MKKILLFSGLALLLIGLHAHGACLLKNIEKETSCTGAAAPIKNSYGDKKTTKTDYKNLGQNYDIPTISVPDSRHNNMPIINPNQGCIYGLCQP